MRAKRYTADMDHDKHGNAYPIMLGDDKGLWVHLEDYFSLEEKHQELQDFQNYAVNVLNSLGTAKFTVENGEFVCIQSGNADRPVVIGTEFINEYKPRERGEVKAGDDTRDHSGDALRYAAVGVDWGKPPDRPLSEQVAEGPTQSPPDEARPVAAPDILEAGGDPAYVALANVLRDAYVQSAHGKGKERHGRGKPFTEQRMQTISSLIGSDSGMLYQAIKKLTEGMDMADHAACERELLGAIVYIAGIIVWRKQQAGDQ